jgi:hypothetical protein
MFRFIARAVRQQAEQITCHYLKSLEILAVPRAFESFQERARGSADNFYRRQVPFRQLKFRP